jgi:hypothetical protein
MGVLALVPLGRIAVNLNNGAAVNRPIGLMGSARGTAHTQVIR